MRIRKRQVPQPFSSISPVPLSSDPNFNRSPVVQLPLQQHPSLPTPCFDPQYPSDHPNPPIGQRLPTQGRDSSALRGTTTTNGEELRKKKNYLVLKRGGGGEVEETGGEWERRNDTRKKNILGAERGIGSLPQSSSSHQAVERWGEGEKAFPLKKRRGSFERRGNHDDTTMAEKDNKKVTINTNKMKTKMNKKFVQQQNENEREEKESKDSASINVVDNDNPSSAKMRSRGGAHMEGSRCSRVNGRGWRCCQQTLVGYSLCEHHLGKGRLRSMTSVRSRSLAGSNNAAKEKKPNNDHEYQTLLNHSSPSQETKQTKRELPGESGENGDEEGEDSKPFMMTKRVKLGMVKARSISSLLGQNDNAIALADHNN